MKSKLSLALVCGLAISSNVIADHGTLESTVATLKKQNQKQAKQIESLQNQLQNVLDKLNGESQSNDIDEALKMLGCKIVKEGNRKSGSGGDFSNSD